MEIKVLGAGCSKCHSTIGIIERAAQAAGVVVQIVKVQNPDEIRQSGVSATPAVMIHGKVVHSGGLPSREEVQTWLKPGPIGFLNHPTRHLFFNGKGGVGKTSPSTAAALMLADAGKKVLLVSTDAASNLDEMLGIELRNTPVPVPGAPGLSVLNLDPDNAAESYRQRVIAQMGADASAEELSTMREQLSGACTTEIRHGADGAHLALAESSQGLDRVSRRQRSRCVLPGAALGPEDAGSALQGRTRRPERPGEDHGDSGHTARHGRHRRSSTHLG